MAECVETQTHKINTDFSAGTSCASGKQSELKFTFFLLCICIKSNLPPAMRREMWGHSGFNVLRSALSLLLLCDMHTCKIRELFWSETTWILPTSPPHQHTNIYVANWMPSFRLYPSNFAQSVFTAENRASARLRPYLPPCTRHHILKKKEKKKGVIGCYLSQQLAEISEVNLALGYLEDLGSDSINRNPASIFQPLTAPSCRAKSSRQGAENTFLHHCCRNFFASQVGIFLHHSKHNVGSVWAAPLFGGWPFNTPGCNNVLWGECWIVNEPSCRVCDVTLDWIHHYAQLILMWAPVSSEAAQPALQTHRISMQT